MKNSPRFFRSITWVILCLLAFGTTSLNAQTKPTRDKGTKVTTPAKGPAVATPAQPTAPAQAPAPATITPAPVKGSPHGTTSGRTPVNTARPASTPMKNTEERDARSVEYVAPTQRLRMGANQRKCNCESSATFYNETSDTLDVFIKVLSREEFPTINGVVMEPINNSRRLPNVVIAPGDYVNLTLGCRGGIYYEALDRHASRKMVKYIIQGTVRAACSNEQVHLRLEGHEPLRERQ